MSSGQLPAVWLPAIRAGSGSDRFTKALCEGLNTFGVRAEVTWLPLRAEYAPWTVHVPRPPKWANLVHANSWLHPRFLPSGLPLLLTVHHGIHHPDALAWKDWRRATYHRHWILRLERRSLQRAGAVVGVSHFVAETARRTILDRPIEVIHNGVDTRSFAPATRVSQSDGPFKLLYVGSWRQAKGVELLPQIMRNLGEGYELRYTREAANRGRMNMPPNTFDLGRLEGDDAVVAAMNDADAFVFPSLTEGFSLAVIEAMSCGLPVIASDIPALAESVEHGRTGYLCPKDQPAAFVSAIRELAGQPELRSAMGTAARERVLKNFSVEGMVRSYVERYKALLG